MTSYFNAIATIAYEGPDSKNPLSFKWYDKNRVVAGKRMEDHLRFAACYWHSFCWNGFGVRAAFVRHHQGVAGEALQSLHRRSDIFSRVELLEHLTHGRRHADLEQRRGLGGAHGEERARGCVVLAQHEVLVRIAAVAPVGREFVIRAARA